MRKLEFEPLSRAKFEPLSRQDSKSIRIIADRAGSLLGGRARLSACMDITACHLNGCPLRLKELAAAGQFDFLHDVTGISRHLNRETGELMNHFLPRYAKAEGKS